MQAILTELNAKARAEGATYTKKRFVYESIKQYIPERIFIALVGPRGAGKTTILKQLLHETKSSFYVSLESGGIETNLFDLAKELEEKDTKLLFIDEIHNYPNFEVELKRIYDFLKINIVCTSSSSISLHELSTDLSRRMRIIMVNPFSFREFVYFEKDEILPGFSLADFVKKDSAKEFYGKILHIEPLFDSYLKGRNYPFTMGKLETLSLFSNILETIIRNDLILGGRITPDEATEVKKMIAFLGKSSVEDTSYTNVAKNIGSTKYKVEKYTTMLEKTFIVRAIFPKGTNVLKEPKILLALPYRLLYKNYEESIGAIREDFFVEAVKSLDWEINYLKSERGEKIPDYLVDFVVFEIGGVTKGASQFKGFKEKIKIILTHPGVIDEMKRPLFMIGLLEKEKKG